MLPKSIERKLTTGEVIYWSAAKQHRTKGRAGKWVADPTPRR